ncbi:MAG: TIGR01906 family membrane protein [Christensenellales bacterium]|jgi:integral membrane protein (TIGR01906 family)
MARHGRTLAAAMGIAAILFAAALGAFLTGAVSDAEYGRVQRAQAVDAGLSPAELEGYNRMLARYLRGDASALDGAARFSARDVLHMADVYHLFALGRKACAAAGILGILLLATALYKNADWRRALRGGAAMGGALFALPILLVGIWAAIDFNGAFTAMHHALFSNDLWQLDPATDRLIRMFPERFFMQLASRLGMRAALASLLVFAAAGAASYLPTKKGKL